LTSAGNQRWRRRRDVYRPPEEPIRTADYDVSEIPDDAPAKLFIETHHYSRSYPAARFRFGLYRRGELAGVAVFSHPCNDRVLTNVFPGDPLSSVELGRFVLEDQVPGNGETWFLGRAFALLRRHGLRGVVSFSDPIPRTNAHGQLVFPGHYGTIYQAHNGIYLGRSTPRALHVLPDGRVLSPRAIQKIRSGDQGRRYGTGLLVAAGAAPPLPNEDTAEWLTHWLARLTRRIHHKGNHRYAWALDRRRVSAGFLLAPKRRDPLHAET
jgi:hypothetical protein